MRVLSREGYYAIAVDHASHDGKRLIFTTPTGKCYYTDDYYSEHTALCSIGDLVKLGYIIVNRLYTKENS